MIENFISALTKANSCIECVENNGFGDTEYNTFSVNGVWIDNNKTNIKLSFNDGATEIYLSDWDKCNVIEDEDDGTVYEFVFGNVKRSFIILPKSA